jgi:AcrR family transcriptional regulator
MDEGKPRSEGGQLTAPPWQRAPQRAARRRREPITSEAITEAALRVLDNEGLDGFSMRRIAEELDTGAASLYWHVGSKDGLLDLIFDRVIGEVQVPDPQPRRWREQLKEVARSLRAVAKRHRDLIRVSLGRIPTGPNALSCTERVLAILRTGGLPDDLAVSAYLLLISTVNGFTLDELGNAGQAGPLPPSADAVGSYLASLPADRFPNIAATAEHFADAGQDQRFELLLDLFVDGLAQRA